MKYIYLDREKAKQGIALVIAVLDERNINYKKEFGEDVVEFTGEDLPHYITYVKETDSIREATEEEKLARHQVILEDNQVIIDNVIYTYDKNYQKVVNGKIVDKTLKELVEESILTLEEVKRLKRGELKIIRNTKINEDLEVDGEFFQVRAEDLQKFFLKKIEADINPELKGNKENWILANNQIKAINFYDIQNILQKYGERQRELFKKFGQLSMRLEACNTVEEIEAIKWE